MGEMGLMTRFVLNQVTDRWETGRWKDNLESKTTYIEIRQKENI